MPIRTIPEPLLWRPRPVVLTAFCVIAFEYAARIATWRALGNTSDPAYWQIGWQISILMTIALPFAVFLLIARRKPASLLESFTIWPGSRRSMLVAAALPFGYLLPGAAAILYFFPEARSAPGEFLDWRGPAAFSFLLTGIVLGPIWEEIFYRGYIFRVLSSSRAGPVGAAVLSSAAFGLHHVDKAIGGQIAMALAGLLFCYVAHRTGTIVYGLIAHMVNNAILIAIDALRALL
jgi:membrane protease YdiL (CAAX protease family)